MKPPLRVLVAKPGLDGHDRGAKVIARALRGRRHGGHLYWFTSDSGNDCERGPAGRCAGDRALNPLGAHNAIVPRVMELLREKEMTDVKVVVGGIIPDEDARELERQGVTKVFQPGASLDTIVACVREAVGMR